MQVPAPDDAEQATTTTPTTRPESLQPLATDDRTALRRLQKYREPLGQYDVDTPFPLDEQQKESLREGAIRPARVPAAEAVRTASQAMISGRSRSKGWGATAALGPVAEGLAQYLEWHAGARDQPSFSRIALESAVPLAFSRENPVRDSMPRPEGESTEREQGEEWKRAKRAFDDLVKQEKQKRGMSTETTWEDVLGEHHRDEPIDVTPESPSEGYTDAEWEELPDDPDWHPPESLPERKPPIGYNRRRALPETPLPEKPLEDMTDEEWDKWWSESEDWPKEQDEIDATPDTGPIAKEPLGEDYIPLPRLETDAEWRKTERMAPFRRRGPVERGATVGALAAARGAGAAGTQPGMNPQFLRRVDAELEARMKGDHAYSIFAPFTNDQLQEMRDVEIHGGDE